MELNLPVSRHVSVVSIFGRGHWLAAALAREGLKVTLIDLSQKMGQWTSEDTEGPFGFFRSERLQELQLESLFSGDAFEEVTNGFTLWQKKGPIEFKSPLTSFYFEKNQWPAAYQDLLGLKQAETSLKLASYYKALVSHPFSQQWIIHLAHQLASTTYAANAEAAQRGNPLPLLSSFYIRRVTRMGLEKSFHWLRADGIEVLAATDIRDFSFANSKTVSGLELTGEKQGVFKTDHLVWTLSSEESYFYSEKIGQRLFPQGAIEPEWGWVRYRLKLEDCREREALPLQIVQMNDLFSPWTHENLIILQRTAVREQFDGWIRLPNVQRFNKEYLTHRGVGICEILNKKMPLSQVQVLTYPQEYYYTYSQLGANRFPVFSESKENERQQNPFRNIALDSPETWIRYSADALFENQEKVATAIIQQWKTDLQKAQKTQQRKENNL